MSNRLSETHNFQLFDSSDQGRRNQLLVNNNEDKITVEGKFTVKSKTK